MEAAVLVPQEAHPTLATAAAKKTATAAPMPKAAAARRKTLCDITNLNSLRRPLAGPEAQDASKGVAAAGSLDDVAQLVKENSTLARLLAERDKIIELSSAELQKLRLANWQLAQANSQMLAELNLGRHRLKALQHELACSRAALKARTLEFEEAKKLTKHNKHPQEKTSGEMLKEGDIDPEPTSDASHSASIKKACNPSRKRMLRSQSLGSAISIKPVTSKEKDVQRRKSLRTRNSIIKSEPTDHTEDLFEIEDVKLAISSNKMNPDVVLDTAKKEATVQICSREDPVQVPRRSSLGRPLRRAAERVASYKEVPVNIKLRRT